MMKSFLICFITFFSTLSLNAQNESEAKTIFSLKLSPKMINTLNQFSVTASIGTPSFAINDLKNISLKKLTNVSLGDITIAYKVNSRMKIGIGTLGSLGNCEHGYFDAEGGFQSFDQDDNNDNDDGMDGPDGIDDNDVVDDNDESNDNDNDNCEDDFGQNLMGSVTYQLSENIPIFVQVAAGYSFSNNALAYSTLIGYNQKLFAGFGISGGIRFSDVLNKLPATAISSTASEGVKLEFSVNWNF